MGKVVIIGGGVAGLSAGITAAMAGHTVTVCEKNRNPGGNLVGWERRGYHIDNCIHWLTGTNPKTRLYKSWQTLGVLGKTELYQPQTLYTAEYNGRSLSLYSSLEKTEAALLSASENDGAEIRSLIRAVRAMNVISETEDFRFSSLPCFISLSRYLGITVRELSERFHSPLIKSFISSFFGDSFGAVALINVISTFTSGNGALPRGGSSAMAEAMAKRLGEVGGELILGGEAVRINTEGSRAVSVVLRDGRVLLSDTVLLACDPIAAKRLLPLTLPAVLRKRYAALPLFSSHHTAFGADCEALPFSSALVIDIPEKYKSTLGGERLVLREFSHEPSFSPIGKSLLEATVFVNGDTALRFIEKRKASPDTYRAYKARLSNIIERLITERFPSLKNKLSRIDSWTPATYERYLNSHGGAYMSFVLPKSYVPKRCTSRLPDYSNVLLATQWQTIPGGLPMAAECGISAARAIGKVKAHKKREKLVID